jgi:membrane protease subunit HflK
MAWNQPGGTNNPWGRRSDRGGSGGGLDDAFRNWQRRFQTLFGSGSGGSGTGAESPGESGALPFVIAGIVVAVWIFSGFYEIESAERGVIQRFGKYTETVTPGIGWRWPWPIETLTRVNVSSVNSSQYTSRVLTADVNLVDLKLAVQYQFADPTQVLFDVRDPENTLRQVSESAIREVVGRSELDAIMIGTTRNELTDRAKALIQHTLDSYRTGILVTTVSLTEVQVPEPVIPSQRDANKALADQERLVKEAEAYASSILPNAEGDAQRQIQNAEAYRSQVTAIATGQASRFTQLAAAYAASPEVTRKRLYLETIEDVLQRSRKVVIDSKGGGAGGGNLLYLPLDKLLEHNPVRDAEAAAGAANSPRPSSSAPAAEPDTVTVEGTRSRGER